MGKTTLKSRKKKSLKAKRILHLKFTLHVLLNLHSTSKKGKTENFAHITHTFMGDSMNPPTQRKALTLCKICTCFKLNQ